MIRQQLSQKLLQKLSPQQIQLMKLLQIPTVSLEQRIKEELEANPALEEHDTFNESSSDTQEEEKQDGYLCTLSETQYREPTTSGYC